MTLLRMLAIYAPPFTFVPLLSDMLMWLPCPLCQVRHGRSEFRSNFSFSANPTMSLDFSSLDPSWDVRLGQSSDHSSTNRDKNIWERQQETCVRGQCYPAVSFREQSHSASEFREKKDVPFWRKQPGSGLELRSPPKLRESIKDELWSHWIGPTSRPTTLSSPYSSKKQMSITNFPGATRYCSKHSL